MAFRDDRDALRAQRDALEADRAKLEKELDSTSRALAEHEDKDEKDEDELARLRKKVAKLEKKVDPKVREQRRRVAAVLAGVVIAGGAAAAAVFVSMEEEPAETAVEDATPVPPAPLPQPVVVPEPPPSPLDVALFGAVVVESTDPDVAVGDGCVLTVGLAPGPTPRHVEIVCRQAVFSASESRARVVERPAGEGWEYRFAGGTRGTDRRQMLAAHTAHGSLMIRTRSVGQVQLRVEQASLPRFGPSLTDAEESQEPFGELEALENEEDDAATLDGAWRGLVMEPGGPAALRLASAPAQTIEVRDGQLTQRAQESGAQLLLTSTGMPGLVTIEIDGEQNTAVLTTPSGARYEGRFGPGAATFLGLAHVAGEAPRPFWLRREGEEESEAAEADPRVMTVDQLEPEQREAVLRAIQQALGSPAGE